MLAQAGFNADIALDAQQAKQRLSENRYTVVTMDIMLPDQDGISLIKELRQQDATKGSAYRRGLRKSRCRETGAQWWRTECCRLAE